MKYIYSSLLLLASFVCSSQPHMSLGYSYGMPTQEMNENINGLHSFTMGYLHQLKGKMSWLMIGPEFSWGSYANERKMQTFNFPNGGGSTETWVYYSSNALQGSMTARVLLAKKDKNVIPYLNGKLGYAHFYSSIYIEDPHDEEGCKPLDQENLIGDGTWMGGYGAGIQLNLAIFSENKKLRGSWIDLGVNVIRGGCLEYINTKKLIDASAAPDPNSDGKAVKVKFINATTQEIHEHQVAEVFKTPLSALEFKASFIFSLDQPKKEKGKSKGGGCQRSKYSCRRS
jgi:hypothetical protein